MSGSGTSFGYQTKWEKGGYYYKQDTTSTSGESIAEVCASRFLKTLVFPNVLVYEPVKKGIVRSKIWLSDGEQNISLLKFLKNGLGAPNYESFKTVFENVSPAQKYEILGSCVTNLGVSNYSLYMKYLLFSDYLVLNPDRHFRNICLIYHKGSYRFSPMFDFGLSLGTAMKPEDTTARPFSESFIEQIRIAGVPSIKFRSDPTKCLEGLPKYIQNSNQARVLEQRVSSILKGSLPL